MTASQMTAPYPKNGILPSSLPNLNKNGFVDDGWLKNYVQTLEANGQIPKLPPIRDTTSAPFDSPDSKDPLNSYTTAESAFHKAIQDEFCYYEAAYLSALDAFLQSLANSSLQQQPGQNVQGNLALARQTNQRITVFTQIVNAIAKDRYTKSQGLQSEINNINDKFKNRGAILAEQAQILNKESASADVHKRMAEYTLEKNKANNNLLTLYSLLNVSAIAMLIYISRT